MKYRKTLLTIDWDYFVPEKPRWNLFHAEEDFFIHDIWNLHAVIKDLHNIMKTNGKEKTFVEDITSYKFNLTEVDYIEVSDSHKVAYDIAIENGITDIISFDAHSDMGYIRNGNIGCANWLRFFLEENPESMAYMILSEESNEHFNIKEYTENVNITKLDNFIRTGDTIWVDNIHICRSGAWTPPWLDGEFNRFLTKFGKDLEILDDLEKRKFDIQEANRMYRDKPLKGLIMEGIGGIYEYCGECDSEVEIEPCFIEQICPNCGERIMPCHMCRMLGFECSKICWLTGE